MRSTQRVKNKIFQKVFLFTVLILAVSLPLAARDNDGHGKGKKDSHNCQKKEFGMLKLQEKLNLTEEQVDFLNSIKDEMDKKRIEKRPNQRDFHKFMIEQVQKDKLNIKEIIKRLKEKDKEKIKIREYIVEKMAEFHATLTDEQKEKIAEHMKMFEDKHEGRGHKGPKGFFFFH